MKHTVFTLALLFSLGIFIGSFVKISFLLVYSLIIIFLLITAFVIKKEGIFYIFLSSLIFLLGILLLKNTQMFASCHISKYISYKNKSPYIVKGYIINSPQIDSKRTAFLLKVDTIQFLDTSQDYNCCGNVLVYIKGKRDLTYGNELILKGRLRRFRFYTIVGVKNNLDIIKTDNNRGFFLKCFAFGLKENIEARISKHLSGISRGVLNAMVLGDKKNIPTFIYNSMVKSGTVHILVVSGFNVGIVVFIVILFLRLIRIPRRIRHFIAILMLIIYCLMTGASNAVLRATIMAIVFMLGFLFRREYDIYNALGLAATFILIIDPLQLFDIGFELSFLSVFSIVYLYPKIKSLLSIDKLKIKFIRFFIEASLVSLSCWLGTMLPVAYYFKVFSPITVLANLFIVPLATLITLCGFSLILIDLMLPSFTAYFASTVELLVALLLKINALLLKLPFAYLPR